MSEAFKSNKLVIFSIVVMLILSLSLITLAFFTPILTEGNIFTTTGTAENNAPDITFTETNSGITLIGSYPMSDENGLETDPYTFTLTNNEASSNVKYEIIIETKSDNTLSNDLVSTSLGGVLTTGTSTSVTNSGYSYAYVIYTGELSPSSDSANASKTFDLRIWINENGTTSNAQNKTWTGKIVVKASKTS